MTHAQSSAHRHLPTFLLRRDKPVRPAAPGASGSSHLHHSAGPCASTLIPTGHTPRSTYLMFLFTRAETVQGHRAYTRTRAHTHTRPWDMGVLTSTPCTDKAAAPWWSPGVLSSFPAVLNSPGVQRPRPRPTKAPPPRSPPPGRRGRGGARKRPGVCVTCPDGLQTAERRRGARSADPGRPARPGRPSMSKLGKFFKRGSSRSRAAPSPQEALARLRETEEMLGKKQEYLEDRIRRELSLARRHGARNKPGRRPAPARALGPRAGGGQLLPGLSGRWARRSWRAGRWR